jgi:hypothetical protein
MARPSGLALRAISVPASLIAPFGIVSKRLGSPYISRRSRHSIKSKNPAAPAVKREAE